MDYLRTKDVTPYKVPRREQELRVGIDGYTEIIVNVVRGWLGVERQLFCVINQPRTFLGRPSPLRVKHLLLPVCDSFPPDTHWCELTQTLRTNWDSFNDLEGLGRKRPCPLPLLWSNTNTKLLYYIRYFHDVKISIVLCVDSLGTPVSLPHL